MAVLTFTGHLLYRCPPHCGGCYVCSGGLACCVTCHGAESSLPTECPQRGMSGDECDRVSEGVLNFRAGEWVCEDASRVRRRG